jgi:UDP-GlcNAc3NAcA epimerase
MKKIVTIIGARPQFIKAAMVSRQLRNNFEEIIIHTGQHYDKNMSEIFFDQLNIPKPKYNLGVGSGTHGKQTGEMLIKIEEILLKEKPDYVLIYGDTNSTLAGALAASKLLIPVIHIEAGLRSYNMKMPEEQNRILSDHISQILICPTQTAVENLKKEGIIQNVYNLGDVMCDSVMYYSSIANNRITKDNIELIPIYQNKKINDWYLSTIHRAENSMDNKNLSIILDVFNHLDKMVIFPVHPRIRKMVDELNKKNNYENIYFIEPVDYLTMLYLTCNAYKVITDSGGLQKECYILNVPCITVRDQTEWVETLKNGYNVLSKPNYQELYNKIITANIKNNNKINYYGDGNSASKIVDLLKNI